MVSQPVVLAESLVAMFGSTAVNLPISFELLPKQLGVFVGGNGSGKTSLLRVLLGEVSYHSKRLGVFNGPPPFAQPWKLTRKRVRMIPQFPVLPYFMTVREYLTLWESCTKKLRLRPDLDGHGHLHETISAQLGISPRVGIRTLSFGQRRMIEILLAAASVPDLLLADEPLAGLGLLWIPVAVEAIERVRASGSAVLMVIHEPERRYWNPDWTIEVVSHRGPS